jgi:ubiquinone/menaquinone biosynthesis C-methylase UbiE
MVIGEKSVTSKEGLTERFAGEYRDAQAGIMRRIERSVCGCDYGATSWTTRREAQTMAGILALGPGKRLLEVGAGSGWPGLYLAAETGCDTVLVDLPFEGLRIAAERAAAEPPPGTCWIAVADGAAIPLQGASVDAILHSDVLCCLEAKLAVLDECRRIVRPGGKMVFTVIFIAPDLPPGDYRQAVAFGPPCIEAPATYPAMLRQAGWDIIEHVDLTPDYAASVRHQLRQEETHATELRELLGKVAYSEKLTRRRGALDAIERGLIRREMFAATPAAMNDNP